MSLNKVFKHHISLVSRPKVKATMAMLKKIKPKMSEMVIIFILQLGIALKKLVKDPNILYYIPLVPRPKMNVTMAMLKKIEPKRSDNLGIRSLKKRLHCNLLDRVDGYMYRYSPHFYSGIVVRCGIYQVFFFLTTSNIEYIPALVCVAIYMGLCSFDDGSLHYQYIKWSQ